ncbi:Protogenin [Varanus komodoensis]|nr:Protogenin [Varanus komodoensis]
MGARSTSTGLSLAGHGGLSHLGAGPLGRGCSGSGCALRGLCLTCPAREPRGFVEVQLNLKDASCDVAVSSKNTVVVVVFLFPFVQQCICFGCSLRCISNCQLSLRLLAMSAFEVQPLPAEVEDGSVARFACKIDSNPPAIITWEVNRTTLPIAMDRITALPSGVLQIYGVQQKDAGNYRCVATTAANRRKSAEAALTVIPASGATVFHKPSIIAGPQNVTASLHQTVIFECIATGNPKPIVSWSRLDHRSIDVFNTRVLGNGNLMISDVKVLHSGVYICRATIPGTRNFTTAMATLVVLAPPAFVEWPESLTRPRAGTARFACQAEGIPPPKMSWLKNGRKIHSNGRIKMYNSKLVINQIIPEDDAIYQCMAENSQGSILSRARLTVVLSEDRPSAPCNVHAETMSSSAILLAWERPLYNSDKVIAYSVHYMKAEGLNNEEYQVVIGNDTTHYTIDDLEPASSYTFYIVAYMPMGASQMSDHVTQHTLEDVPLRAPEISLTSRSPTDILISWLPIPAKYRRGQVVSFRLSYRLSTESTVQVLELPGTTYEHLLRGLKADSVYLVRISAATRIGWGEASLWTSHRTPKATSIKAPKSPELHLEPVNCTAITVRWQQDTEDTAAVQGYKLHYREEGQQENGPILLEASDLTHTIGGLDGLPGCPGVFPLPIVIRGVLGEAWEAFSIGSTICEAFQPETHLVAGCEPLDTKGSVAPERWGLPSLEAIDPPSDYAVQLALPWPPCFVLLTAALAWPVSTAVGTGQRASAKQAVAVPEAGIPQEPALGFDLSGTNVAPTVVCQGSAQRTDASASPGQTAAGLRCRLRGHVATRGRGLAWVPGPLSPSEEEARPRLHGGLSLSCGRRTGPQRIR